MATYLAHTFLCMGMLTSLCYALSAQEPSKMGAIVIEVKDQSGAVASDAQVQILPSPNTIGKDLTTGSDGKLSLNVPPGNYDLRVTLRGFLPYTKRIEVQNDTRQTIDVVLKVGSCPPGNCLIVSNVAYGGETPEWKVFSNRAGWSINYPVDWKIGSCKSCQDPTEPNVFVDFFPPSNSDSGWVMVERLANRPSGTTVDAWFTKIKETVNLNPRLTEERLTLNDLPALKVRYRNANGGVHEMEEVYVVTDSRTFAITFDVDNPGHILEEFGNYNIFLQMVEGFKAKH